MIIALYIGYTILSRKSHRHKSTLHVSNVYNQSIFSFIFYLSITFYTNNLHTITLVTIPAKSASNEATNTNLVFFIPTELE